MVECPDGGPGPRLALYIDGTLKGEAAGVGACLNGWTATGTSLSSLPYAATDAVRPVGDANLAWPSGPASDNIY